MIMFIFDLRPGGLLWFDLHAVSSSQALEAEDKRVKQVDTLMQLDERKRPYNSLGQIKAPSEEEMEAFRMKRCRPDDPMASFLGQWRHLCSRPNFPEGLGALP